MTPCMPPREWYSPPKQPSLPPNEAGSPPCEDEEIASHEKPTSDDAQQKLLPRARSRYSKDQHDIAKRYNKVLDKTIYKAKARLNWRREILKLNDRRAEKWKENLELATHDYDEAYEDALQIRVEADNIISFISLAEKMPDSIKPSPENMSSYKETLADFEERYRARVELEEMYKRRKGRIFGMLEKLSREVKDWEGKIQEDSETLVEIEREQRYAMMVEQLAQMDGKDGMRLVEAHPRFLNDLEAMIKHSEGEVRH
ncbi:uncharacterized protein B0J16DRAFT_388497 [Fusarium flagelliforme]|uniref:Uncharacterized protein n=1 Tax=Fusarium flagelliforme TaxID=2675880 RepID=A0A395M8I8_9HYPO|nr:uncharacterized protein B0J16DRAFT_388497 [Fusarium flagelliforme]KAH7174673.1 hypothetical protein B0J16DRAFT_388497 [Fusarium flagelliforme]RFN44188.1 hypothetical protein FIE12Z_11580 [Fusarium flagelliforme]